MSTDNLTDLLAIDPLAEAEHVTGKSYKDDADTLHLGMAMHLVHAQAKRQALTATRDTHYNSTLPEQIDVFADLGFEPVLTDTFSGRSYSDEPAPDETFTILWNPAGVLATVESYRGDGRNSAKMYYNWQPAAGHTAWDVISSGHTTGSGVLIGDHDVREGLRHTFNRMTSLGAFLPQWVERPWLWLLTYTDTDAQGYDHKAITEARIARLPENVRDAIGGAA
jgi:hypothetical protein